VAGEPGPGLSPDGEQAGPTGAPLSASASYESSGFGSFRHLAERFFGALDPRGPDPVEEAWALGWLLPGEQQLWNRMSGPDRRHAAGVAREVAALLDDGRSLPGREVMAAALLHDVGKIESGLGTFARVGVTLAAMAVGRERLTAPEPGREPVPVRELEPDPTRGSAPSLVPARSEHWAAPRWFSKLRRRAQVYLTHDRVGAELLAQAGAHPTTVSWAAEHHLPAARWTVERRVAEALKAADGD
jgi:hypothetical protein